MWSTVRLVSCPWFNNDSVWDQWCFQRLPVQKALRIISIRLLSGRRPSNFQILPLVDKYSTITFFWKKKKKKAQRSNISPLFPEETNTSLKSFFEAEIKQIISLLLHLPPFSTVPNKMWKSLDAFLLLPKQRCTFYIQTERNSTAESEEKGMKEK